MRRWGILLALGIATPALAALVDACGDTTFNGTESIDGSADGASEASTPDGAATNDAATDSGGIAPCDNDPGAAETFVKASNLPDQVASDGIYIYWASTSTPTIERALLTDAPPANILPVSTRPSGIDAIGVTSSHLCWIDHDIPADTTGVLECVGTSAISASGADDAGVVRYNNQVAHLWSRATDFLYTRTNLDILGPPSDTALLYVTPSVLASAADDIVFVHSGDAGPRELYEIQATMSNQSLGAPFNVDPGDPTAIATDGTNVYVSDTTAQTVSRFPLDGGAAAKIATGQIGLGAISLDKGNAYFVTGTGIARVADDGTCLTKIAAEPTTSFVIQGDYVYFASGGAILRARK